MFKVVTFQIGCPALFQLPVTKQKRLQQGICHFPPGMVYATFKDHRWGFHRENRKFSLVQIQPDTDNGMGKILSWNSIFDKYPGYLPPLNQDIVGPFDVCWQLKTLQCVNKCKRCKPWKMKLPGSWQKCRVQEKAHKQVLARFTVPLMIALSLSKILIISRYQEAPQVRRLS